MRSPIYIERLQKKKSDEVVESADKNVDDVEENSTQEVEDSYTQQTPPNGSSQTVEEKWEELAQQLITRSEYR